MYKIVNSELKFPKVYPKVTRKEPTLEDKGWDMIGDFRLRDKMDLMPQEGMQETMCKCSSNLVFACGAGTSGKAQPYDAKVLTPNGFVDMGSLKVGDTILGVDGKPQQVLRIFEQGEKDVYRLTFDDGAQTECCKEHLWTFRGKCEGNLGDVAVLELEDIMYLHSIGIEILIPKYKCEVFDADHCNTLRSYERVGKKPCRCILVSNEDHLYVTDDFIVTHNTFMIMLSALKGVGLKDYTARLISVRLQDSKKGSSIFRDANRVWGDFANCQVSSSDYPTFYWAQWNNSIQLIHSNFNVENPSEWVEFTDYSKKVQASYIGIDEATEMRSFKMFAFWFMRNRDDSGMTPQMVLTFNPVHDHFTTRMLKDAGCLTDDWYLRPEMIGKELYFYIKGDTVESIVWGKTRQEVVDAVGGIEITAKERKMGLKETDMVKSFMVLTGEAADNKKLVASTKGGSVANLHAMGETLRSINKGAYFGAVENETLQITRQMIHNLWTNPKDDDDTMYATMDVSGAKNNSDGCPMIIWKGLQIIAIPFYTGGDMQELVSWIYDTLRMYGVPIENFAFDATGIGYYLKDFTKGFPVTFNKRPMQEYDEYGNPINLEMYFNLRSQMLGKMKVLFERGDVSCALDKETELRYGRNGRKKPLINILFDEMNVFTATTRNTRIYYRSKEEYKAKFHSSPDIMDSAILRSVFTFDAKKKKQAQPEYDENAYLGLYGLEDADTEDFELCNNLYNLTM